MLIEIDHVHFGDDSACYCYRKNLFRYLGDKDGQPHDVYTHLGPF